MMSARVLFFFALVALAYGLPAAQTEAESKAVQEVPAELDSYLDSLFPGDGGEASLTIEPQSDASEVHTRHRRACRTISIRTRSGRVISAKRC